ncbi:MAG: hypothetical protein WCQ57_08050 [Verrucomicrobiota bacterium]
MQNGPRATIDIRFGQGETRGGDDDRHVAGSGGQHGALGDPLELDAVDVEVGTTLQQQRAVASQSGGTDEQRALIGHAETFAQIFRDNLWRVLTIALPFNPQTLPLRLIENKMHEEIASVRRR